LVKPEYEDEMPNAALQARLKAEATQERTLEAVTCKR
jgi:hypothetical protein